MRSLVSHRQVLRYVGGLPSGQRHSARMPVAGIPVIFGVRPGSQIKPFAIMVPSFSVMPARYVAAL